MKTLLLARWPILGLLLFGLISVPAPLQSQEKTQPTLTAEEKAKQLADLEKQIADLQSKFNAIKAAPVKPTAVVVPEGTIPADYMKSLTWRNIGPANMGGRITALAVNEADPTNYWVATASGGLLKTVNNGISFEFQFDKQSTVSIGDVAVAKSNPQIVWVGTGENNPRNSVSYGDGVYKSTDGGKTFTNVGLKNSFQIGKILIHPTNPDIVYVGALGRLYGPSEERGVFKTEDGGKTWKKALFVNNKTGVQEMIMDPNDPNTVFAALWEHQRDEFDGFFGEPPVPDAYGTALMHGPGSGLYKTTDGGKNWTKLNGAPKSGLPTVNLGRIGLDYSRKTKGLLVAIIDTEKVGTGTQSQTYFGFLGNTAPNGAGVNVTEVTEDGPAAKGGVKNGDLIVKYDDTKAVDYDAFVDYFSAKNPGDKLKLLIKRDGKDVTVDVTLGTRSSTPPTGGGGGTRGAVPSVGFRLGRGDALKIGTLVEGGPAEKAGLKADDEITALDGKAVANIQEYFTALTGKKAGDKVKFTVKRGTETKDFEVTLGAPQGGTGGGGTPPGVRQGGIVGRPYIASGVTGGQQANVQNRQGKDGFQTGGVFVSKDNGETWTRVNSLNPRPFYFSQIRMDPMDDKTIYVLGDVPVMWRSTNGGTSFQRMETTQGVHADAHALWINPKDSRHMIIGCDGGFYVSFDKGTKWDHLNNFALAQFYHVCVDNRRPYRVYGGLQDNGSWGGPSDTKRRSGPYNEDWVFVQGGDGFVCRVDPNDPDLVYSESQGGAMSRRNFRTGEAAGIRPVRRPGDEPLRFNWNTPFILSSHNSSIFYCGAQFVYRSYKKGDDLKQISPDLTRTKKGSMTAIAESPKNSDVLWAGTDDGHIWITRDGGAKWENVTPNLLKAGLPGYRWISTIETSREKDGRAYVCLDAHRSNDDKPYVFVTEDFGATWKSITSNLPEFGSTRCLREDIVNFNVLYCGTEFGAFVSINRGASWTKLGSNLPTVACHEFALPTTATELVVGTHGRGVWIIDINAIRTMKPENLKAGATTLLPPATATRWKIGAGGESPYSQTDRKFMGTNPTRGAFFEYVLTATAKEAAIKVMDVTGKQVVEFRTIPKAAGLHRVNWNLAGAATGRPGPGGRPVGGGAVPPGVYSVILTVDGKEYKQSVAVELDPNAPKDIIATEGDVEELEAIRKSLKKERDPVQDQ